MIALLVGCMFVSIDDYFDVFTVTAANASVVLLLAEFFVPVTCFLFFNIGDYFGRSLPGFFQFVCYFLAFFDASYSL